MFKMETHLHTAEVSPCSRLSAAEMVELYRRAGYRTVMISDHFQQDYLERVFGKVPWEAAVDGFLSGYRAAVKAAAGSGMHILLSAEVQFTGCPNHYLLYGFDREFLVNCPDLLTMGIEAFYPYARERGVTVVQAHPLRDCVCTPTPAYVDGFEGHNSNPRHRNFDDDVAAIAREYGKPLTAGSDAHRLEDVALSGVLSRREICTVQDYVDLLLAGELKLITGEDDDAVSAE